ncbi:MAG: hypothetical protein ABJA81_00845 [Nocardioidaceae bacterium]
MLTSGRRRHLETGFVVLPPIAVIWAITGEAPIAWRGSIAAVFFLVSPGLAVLSPARLRWELELAMLLPTSAAMTTLVSLALFYAGVWTPTLTVIALSAVCAVGVLSAAARDLGAGTRLHAHTGWSDDTAYHWEDVT